MGKTLHILNGDLAVQRFSLSKMKGNTLIWREMLCEGPLHPEVGSDSFWMKRYRFFEETYNISKLDYFDRTIKEILKISNNEQYHEAVLWFGSDLFCQINLLAACSFLLHNYRKDIRYSLAYTGKKQINEKWGKLNDYPPGSFRELYEKRIKLTRNDLLLARRAWELFVKNDPSELKNFDFNQNKKFRYLQKAVNQHLKRFPDKDGLSEIDRKIIEITKKDISDEKEIVKELLLWQKTHTVYGFNDLQYRQKIKNLKERKKI